MELEIEYSLFSEWYDRNIVMKFIFEESSSLMLCVNSATNEIFKASKRLIQILGYDSNFEVNNLNIIMSGNDLKEYFDSLDNFPDKVDSIQVYLKTKNNDNIPVIIKAKKIKDTDVSFWLLEIKSKYNEEYFKILFENYSDIVFIHDIHGNILYTNKTAIDYLGCSIEEIRGKNLSNFGVSIDFHVLENNDNEISKFSLVSLLTNKDGETHDVKIDSKLVEIGSEKFVMSVIRETTLFKQPYIEKRLLESSLGQILHFMNVGIIIFNEEGYMTHISSNCEAITGISGDSWNENAPFLVDKIVKEDFKVFRQNIEKVFKGEILKDIRIAFSNESGDKKEVKGGFIPIVGDNNNVTEVILAIEEYGEEDRNTRILNFRNLILDNAPIGIITFDLEGNYTFVNEEFLKLLGYEFTYEEVLKWNLYKLMDRDKILPGFVKAVEGETVDYTRDYMPTPSEQKFSFYQLFAPLKDKDGSIIGVLGLLNEITDKSIISQNMMESEEKYREIFHLLEDSIILFKQTEKIADANRCTFVLLGEPIDSIVTKNFRDYFEKIEEKEEDFFSDMHSLGEAYVQTNLKRSDDVIIPVTIYAKGLEISGFQYFVAVIRKVNDSNDDYKSTSIRLIDTNKDITDEETIDQITDSEEESVDTTESDAVAETDENINDEEAIDQITDSEEESVDTTEGDTVAETNENINDEEAIDEITDSEEESVDMTESDAVAETDENINAEEAIDQITDSEEEVDTTEGDAVVETNNEIFYADNFIDMLKIPIVKIGKDAIIKKINASFTSIFDYSEDDVKDKYLSDIVTQDLRLIQEFLSGGDQNCLLEQKEIFVKHKNATFLRYSISYLLVENNDYLVLFREKGVPSFVLRESDLSEECKNRIQLMQSLTGRISSVYSLYIYLIQGYVSLLAEGKNIKDNNKYKIEKLVSLISEIESYTDKLLVFSQSKTLLTKEFNLLPLMKKVMLEYEQKYNFLKIENSVSNTYINGNAEILETMFYDLLEYLCGVVGEKGSILITVLIVENEEDNSLWVENNNKILLICIKEQGYMIPEEILPNIFEPFVSSVNINKCNIGLSFVYGVVKSLGGVIQVNKDREYDYSISIKIPVKTS